MLIGALSIIGAVATYVGNINSRSRKDLARLRKRDVAWVWWDFRVTRAWAARGLDPSELPAKDAVLTDDEDV